MKNLLYRALKRVESVLLNETFVLVAATLMLFSFGSDVISASHAGQIAWVAGILYGVASVLFASNCYLFFLPPEEPPKPPRDYLPELFKLQQTPRNPLEVELHTLVHRLRTSLATRVPGLYWEGFDDAAFQNHQRLVVILNQVPCPANPPTVPPAEDKFEVEVTKDDPKLPSNVVAAFGSSAGKAAAQIVEATVRHPGSRHSAHFADFRTSKGDEMELHVVAVDRRLSLLSVLSRFTTSANECYRKIAEARSNTVDRIKDLVFFNVDDRSDKALIDAVAKLVAKSRKSRKGGSK